MARRTTAPSPRGRQTMSGGPTNSNNRSNNNSSASRPSTLIRLILVGGLSVALWGAYLYSRALRAVSLGADFSSRQQQLMLDREQSGIMAGGGGGGGGPRRKKQNKKGRGRGGEGGLKGSGRVADKDDEEEVKEYDRDLDHDVDNDSPEMRDDNVDVESDPITKTEEMGGGIIGNPFSGISGDGKDDSPDKDDATEDDESIGEYKTPWGAGKPPPTPAWHMDSDPDDSFEKIYLDPSERAGYKHLRTLGAGNGNVNKGAGIKHFFNPMCRHYRFNETVMPTVSVIMTTQNEPDDWISLSVESILGRTPPELLMEVIVVDDNGMPGHHGLPADIRKNVDEAEWDYIKGLSPKVKVIQHDNREGCGRSRLTGAKAATGEVLMFVDSHIEMLSSTWYHHLAVPIMENPRTIAMQTIDVIDDLGTKDYGAGVGPLQYGIVNTEFWFGYQADRFGDYMEPLDPTKFTEEELRERKNMKYKAEVPHGREPYETPFGPGSLFAIRADEFWRLGGYDEGLYVWGGENTEMAFKAWMCGGRMLMVPCSRVGHMYRQHKEKDGRGALTRWPPTLPREMTDRLGCAYKNGTYTGRFVVLKHPADNFTRITTRNNLRVMETWVGEHPAKYAYYKRLFGQETLKPEFQHFIDEWRDDPAAQKQVQIKKDNKCHDFEWWDKYVFMRLTGRHHPWHVDNKKYQKISCGNHKAKSCEQCPQGNGKDWCNGDCAWCELSKKCFPVETKNKLCKSSGRITKETAGDMKDAISKQKRLDDNRKRLEESRAKAMKAKEDTAGPKHLKVRERARLPESMKQDGNQLTLSIVLPCGFEHDYFIRTAESIFYETPSEILKEIVLVDDASQPPLKESWSEELASKFSVKYVRLDSPHGLIGAKQAGAEAATGDIIVFFDCHVKPAEDYWVPYVREVQENYKRVVIPTITNLNVDSWTESGRPSGSGGGMSKCYLTFDAEFKWTTDNTPYVPIMSGGLLAISRKWFFEIGGYDSSMKGWGGENLDQSLRIWTCGGEIVTAPQSYVAHMWRDGTAKTKAKYKLGAGDAIKNRARAVKAHLGPWFEKTLSFPSFEGWRGKDIDTSSITDAFSNLKCENFEWYLNRFKHIYRDAGVVPSEVYQIEAISSESSSPSCLGLKTMGWTNYGSTDEIVLKECAGPSSLTPKSIWWHLSNRLKDGSCCGSIRAWNTDQCIDGRNPQLGGSKISSYTCDLDSGLETFLQASEDAEEDFLLKIGRNGSHQCISVEGDSALKIVKCNNASKWRKRHAFTPIEYELLGSGTRSGWESDS